MPVRLYNIHIKMKGKIKHIVLVLSFLWMVPSLSFAQLDPTLTAMILEYTQKAKSQYNSQLEVMAVETEGHVWLKQEVEATKNYQEQFDRYISTFRGIISYAAQVYGFYYEINHLTENMGRLSHQIGDTPVNAIAVALHHHRNDIYVDIINQSIGIVNTIRQVCIDTKMTEKQRIELVFSIRPQLQQMNRKLAMLTKLVRWSGTVLSNGLCLIGTARLALWKNVWVCGESMEEALNQEDKKYDYGMVIISN